jgi:hypothetical protein
VASIATTSWRGSMNRLFLEWGGVDCCVLAKKRWGIRLLEGWGGAGPGSGAEEV